MISVTAMPVAVKMPRRRRLALTTILASRPREEGERNSVRHRGVAGVV